MGKSRERSTARSVSSCPYRLKKNGVYILIIRIRSEPASGDDEALLCSVVASNTVKNVQYKNTIVYLMPL